MADAQPHQGGANRLGKYVDLRYDEAFKIVFKHPEVLVPFLNTFMKLEGEQQIKAVTYRDKELNTDSPANRGARFDLYCTTESGTHFIIEMQKRRQANFVERALYYIALHIQEQVPQKMALDKGQGYVAGKGDEKEWDYALDPMVFVGIMDFALFTKDRKPVHRCTLTDKDTGLEISDTLLLLMVELVKFDKSYAQCETEEERWLFYLKHLHTLDLEPEEEPSPHLRALLHYAKVANLTQEQRDMLTYEMDRIALANAELKGARLQGHEEGRLQGREEGHEEGREEAEAKAYQEKLMMARSMVADGVPLPVVMKHTGLTEKEILG